MFTDTVGYTASTHTDEARALETLRQQAELVRPLFEFHRGREIKSTGDGFLVEFESALKATQCAVDIQRRIYERNAEGTLEPIQIRVGIHLGDVVESGADILGDAVNIAARIEPVADPGGICVSGAVREQVWNKIPEKLEKVPPTALKGLRTSIDLYRVILPWAGKESTALGSGTTGIAVLPFVNISPDPKDEYFADGLTEELITVLSQLGELRVIARTSVMPYKSAPKGIAQTGADLRVSSILEGSVRKVGNRLRVTAQLIDVATEGHLWAKTYDRDLEDVLAVQAELAKAVSESLKIELKSSETARLLRRPQVQPDSYLAYLKGRTLLHERTQAALNAAKDQFEKAIASDPSNAAAYSGLADTRILLSDYAGADWPEALEASQRLATRAIELDPDLAEAHASLALVLESLGQMGEAEREFALAVSLNPSSATTRHWYAILLENRGRPEEALRQAMFAQELDPLSSVNFGQPAILLTWLGRFEEAKAQIEKLGKISSLDPLYRMVLLVYHQTRSEFDECLRDLDRYREMNPGNPLIPGFYAETYAGMGRRKEAMERLQTLIALPDSVFGKHGQIAAVYCLLGDMDECFRWLEIARQRHSVELGAWRFAPWLRPAREDPRFEKLIDSMDPA